MRAKGWLAVFLAEPGSIRKFRANLRLSQARDLEGRDPRKMSQARGVVRIARPARRDVTSPKYASSVGEASLALA
jgi:hypothetical protein